LSSSNLHSFPTRRSSDLEDSFKGMVLLLEQKARIFKDDLGKEIEEVEIPEDMKADAAKWRATLIEQIAEANDELLEKYLAGEERSEEHTSELQSRENLVC